MGRLLRASASVTLAILVDASTVAALELSRVSRNYITVSYTDPETDQSEILRFELVVHGPAEINEFAGFPGLMSTTLALSGACVTSTGQTITGISGNAVVSGADPEVGTVQTLELTVPLGPPLVVSVRVDRLGRTAVSRVVGPTFFTASAELAESNLTEFGTAFFGGTATKTVDTCGEFPSSFGFTTTFDPSGAVRIFQQAEAPGAPQIFVLTNILPDGSFSATGTGTTFGDSPYAGILSGQHDHRALDATLQLSIGPGLCLTGYRLRGFR